MLIDGALLTREAKINDREYIRDDDRKIGYH